MKETLSMRQSSLEFLPLDAPIAPGVLRAFRRGAGWNETEGAQGSQALRPGSRVQWVTARLYKKTVAIARLELAPPQFCFVSDFIVQGACRGQGVGQWFMARIEAHCLQQGIPRLLLTPAADSQGFYEKLHFGADPLVAGFLRKELLPLQRRPLPFWS